MKLSAHNGVNPALPRTQVPHISLVFREMWGATVGRPFTTWTDIRVQCGGIPHLAKTSEIPEFPARSTGHDYVCAFLKERRVKCAAPNKLHRKSGIEGHPGSWQGNCEVLIRI